MATIKSTKEKAKAYDEAIERANELYDEHERDIALLIFPELRESEDEKIRKAMIDFFKHEREEGITVLHYGVNIESMIAWLEKQGEQKQDDKVEPKFKVGDTMRTLEEANSGITDGMPVVVSIDDKYYRCNNELIAIKDQYDYEYPPINRKQKPAEWSEEDEKIKESIITGLEMLKDGASDKSLIALYNKKIEWLKSIRPQNTWKPSEEQMEALEHFVRSIGESGYASPYDNNTKLLYSLLSDLKKLKG